jgi:type I restriction enzyme S subunit
MTKYAHVGDAIRLSREFVEVDPLKTYQSAGVRSFGKGIFHYPPAPGADLSKLQYFRLAPDALILSNIKAWEGAIAVSSEEDACCVASNRFLSYRPIDPETVDVRYLRWFFLSERGLPLIRAASPGAADRSRTLGISAFEDINIPLPSIKEQRDIADHLDALFRTGEEIERVAMLQRKRLEALSGRLINESSSRMRLGEVLTLDCVIENVRLGQQYELAGVYGFGRGLFARGVLLGEETSYRTLNRLHAGWVVMSRLKAFEGAVAVVPEEFDGCMVSPEFPTFSLRTEFVSPGYMEMLCEWPGFRELLSRASKGIGARRERVGAEAFLSLSVPMPDLPRQHQLVALYSKVRRMRHIDRHRRQVAALLWRSALSRVFANVG